MDQGLKGMKGDIWVDNSKAPKPEPKPKPKPAPQSPKLKVPAPAPVAAPVPQPPPPPQAPAKPDTPVIQHIEPPRQAPATTLSAATQASPQPPARAPPLHVEQQRAPSSQPRSVRYPTLPPQDLSTLRRAEQYAQQLQAQLHQSTSPARVQVRVSMRSSPPSATPDVRSAYRHHAEPVGYSPSSVVTSTESSDLSSSSSSTPSTPSSASVAPPRLRSEPPPPAYRGGVGGGSVGCGHQQPTPHHQQRGYTGVAASPPPHTLPPAPPLPRYTPPAEAYRMPPPMRAGPAVGAVGVVCEAPQFTRQERRITTPSGGGEQPQPHGLQQQQQGREQGPSVAAEEDAAGLLQLMTGSGELRALLEGERGGGNLDTAQVRQLADKLLGYYTARMSEPHKEEVLHLLSVHLLAGHIAADTAQKQPTSPPARASTAATTTQTSRLPTPLLRPHHEPPPTIEPEPEPEPEQRGPVPTPDGGFDASALLRPISSAPAPPSSPAERPVLPAAAAAADTADQALPPASAAPRGSLQTCRTNPTATPTASRRVTPAMRPDDSPPPPPQSQQAPPPSAAAAAAPSLAAYGTRFSHTPVSAPDPGRLLDPVFAEGQGYRTPGSSALSTRMRDTAKGRPVRAAALPAQGAAAAATPEPAPVEPQQVAAAAAAAGAPAAAPRTYDRLVAHPSVSADQLGREITELFMALDPAVVPGAHYPAGPPAAAHQHSVPAMGTLGATAHHSFGPSSVPQFPSYTAAGPSPYPAYPQGQLPHINVRVNYGGDSDAAGTVSASAETPSRLSASPVHHRHQYATPSYHTASPSIPPPPPYDNDSDEDTVVGTFR